MRRATFGALLWLLLSCGHTPLDYEVSGPPRDFGSYPAVVTLGAPPTLYAGATSMAATTV